MTERELFKKLYRMERIENSRGFDCAKGSRLEVIFNYPLGGIGGSSMLRVRRAAQAAVVLRKRPHREPSKRSVSIQMLLFTFGRVRRDA